MKKSSFLPVALKRCQMLQSRNRKRRNRKIKYGNSKAELYIAESPIGRWYWFCFLQGNSSYRIKRVLEADGVKNVTEHTAWSATVID
ncbi:MAG: hypothetical protein LUH21_08100 [Clostridiales bacterium]|nr:hypothetical protein [Clostridiales bacterium]